MKRPTSTKGRSHKKADPSVDAVLSARTRSRVAQRNNLDPIALQKSLIKQKIEESKRDLPHRYGFPWYRWAREFYESRNPINLLCAGNQVSKSSTCIRKNIEWACNKKLWPSLWPTSPRQFWYFYPTDEVATIEFEKKWIPEFMPRGAMKNDENWGWDAEYAQGRISAIHFRSGVTIYFKTYSQRIVNLQTATVHMISGDEEMPEDMVDELLARLSATDGYFNLVFTATQGLQLWYRAMECQGKSEEAFPKAFKLNVTLFDCTEYEDGTPSPWTKERIEKRIASCTSQSEVLRRVYGRFVRDEGRKYGAFDPEVNVVSPSVIPSDWRRYAAVDIGSGGKGRSSAAIVFVAVSPEYTKGRIYKTWRGDLEDTTASDILEKYREMSLGDVITQACYDYQSREFGLIASRSGMGFQPADKARDAGEQTLNTLFKARALDVEDSYDAQKLITELMSIPAGGKNRSYQDDLTDALRYVANMIPWDFPRISPTSVSETSEAQPEFDPDAMPPVGCTSEEYYAWEVRQRRGLMDHAAKKKDDWGDFYQEIDEWNDLYGA